MKRFNQLALAAAIALVAGGSGVQAADPGAVEAVPLPNLQRDQVRTRQGQGGVPAQNQMRHQYSHQYRNGQGSGGPGAGMGMGSRRGQSIDQGPGYGPGYRGRGYSQPGGYRGQAPFNGRGYGRPGDYPGQGAYGGRGQGQQLGPYAGPGGHPGGRGR